MLVKFKKMHPDAKLPTYAHTGDAGLDLFGLCVETRPGCLAIRTGVSVEIPQGHVGLIWGKSGLAAERGIQILGGVIDAGYRGEIAVLVECRRDPFCIQSGEKIAQLLIQPIVRAEPEWAEELPISTRGEGGFGSTGK